MMLFLSRELNDFLGGFCYAHNLKFFQLLQTIIYDWAVTKGFKHECRRGNTKTANQTVCMICGKVLPKRADKKVLIEQDDNLNVGEKIWK